jgi:hypothetical protein
MDFSVGRQQYILKDLNLMDYLDTQANSYVQRFSPRKYVYTYQS